MEQVPSFRLTCVAWTHALFYPIAFNRGSEANPRQHCKKSQPTPAFSAALCSFFFQVTEPSEFSLLRLISCHHRTSDFGYSSLSKVKLMAVPLIFTVHNPKASNNLTMFPEITSWILS